MAPILDKINDSRGDIKLIKIDADDPQNEDILRDYDVRSIPTLVLLDPDGEVLGQVIGAKSEREMNSWLDEKMEVVS